MNQYLIATRHDAVRSHKAVRRIDRSDGRTTQTETSPEWTRFSSFIDSPLMDCFSVLPDVLLSGFLHSPSCVEPPDDASELSGLYFYSTYFQLSVKASIRLSTTRKACILGKSSAAVCTLCADNRHHLRAMIEGLHHGERMSGDHTTAFCRLQPEFAREMRDEAACMRS